MAYYELKCGAEFDRGQEHDLEAHIAACADCVRVRTGMPVFDHVAMELVPEPVRIEDGDLHYCPACRAVVIEGRRT